MVYIHIILHNLSPIRNTNIIVGMIGKLFSSCWLWIPVTFWTLYFHEFFVSPLPYFPVDWLICSSQSRSSDRMMRDCSLLFANSVFYLFFYSVLMFIFGFISHYVVRFINTGMLEEEKIVNPIIWSLSNTCQTAVWNSLIMLQPEPDQDLDTSFFP